MPETYGWLRHVLDEQGISWHRDDLSDDISIQEHALGGSAEGIPAAAAIGPIDLRAALAPTTNPHLAARRVALDLASDIERALVTQPGFAPQPHVAQLPGAEEPPEGAEPPAGGVRPAALDWRNRFGGNWITTVRDQNPCNSCWAFVGTALVEGMLKIEDTYWARLSEGDLHDGIGLRCADGNNLGSVSDFLSTHGLADPGCWPYHTDDAAYAPTPDRAGRTVRMPAFTWVGDLEQQKQWLDSTGPLATWFDVWHDFDGYTGGYVYRRSSDPGNYERGGHFLLIVGYDDNQQAWICKNSWGTGWGDHGYVLVGYGEAGVDQYAKAGLSGLNPDPWTKRRAHNGNLYESGNGGLHRNLEVVGTTGGTISHHWREGGPPWTWNVSDKFANDAVACPTLTGTTYNRNLEVVYLTGSGQLHHWWRGGGGGSWNDGGVFGPSTCQGVPGFIQSDYGAPGNFEVVVKVAGEQLQHLWRMAGPPWTWFEGPRFGSNIAMSGPSLVQSDYYGNTHGNLECVAVLSTGQMQHFWRNEPNLTWYPGPVFGSGVSSPPAMIQGQYGMHDESGPHGNFELCVTVDGQIQHWWRDNAGGSGTWHQSATFGHDVFAVTGMAEGSWGMNLKVMALRTDGQLQHYWRDGAGWHEGPAIGPA